MSCILASSHEACISQYQLGYAATTNSPQISGTYNNGIFLTVLHVHHKSAMGSEPYHHCAPFRMPTDGAVTTQNIVNDTAEGRKCYRGFHFVAECSVREVAPVTFAHDALPSTGLVAPLQSQDISFPVPGKGEKLEHLENSTNDFQ